jgi:hypothetical protein
MRGLADAMLRHVARGHPSLIVRDRVNHERTRREAA